MFNNLNVHKKITTEINLSICLASGSFSDTTNNFSWGFIIIGPPFFLFKFPSHFQGKGAGNLQKPGYAIVTLVCLYGHNNGLPFHFISNFYLRHLKRGNHCIQSCFQTIFLGIYCEWCNKQLNC